MNETYTEVIKRQDESQVRVERLFEALIEAQRNLGEFYAADPIFKSILTNLENKSKDEIADYLIEATKPFKKSTNYQASLLLVNKLNKAEHAYYRALHDYMIMIDHDRKNLFSIEYLVALDVLADDGFLFYFLRTPDYPLAFLEAQNFAKLYVEHFAKNIDYIFSEITNKSTTSFNELELYKMDTLKNAIIFLKNKQYDYCAIALLTLIENDYTNADNVLKPYRKGHEKALNIKNKLDQLGFSYLINAFAKISAYYKRITINTAEWDKKDINRNALMHGTFDRKTTEKDCIKLFTMFMSFKEITYLVQRVDDLMTNLEHMAILARKMKD